MNYVLQENGSKMQEEVNDLKGNAFIQEEKCKVNGLKVMHSYIYL